MTFRGTLHVRKSIQAVSSTPAVKRFYVQEILEEVRNQPGQLPLVEHALYEVWEQRDRQGLTLHTYKESGGVKGAVASRAEAIYTAFNQAEKEILRLVTLRLTRPGEGVERFFKPMKIIDRIDQRCRCARPDKRPIFITDHRTIRS